MQYAKKIVHFVNDFIIPNFNKTQNYTIDIGFTNGGPYFIELNSFGKEYAAGSALFHWINDEQ